MIKTEVHKSFIVVGDTVIHNGVMRTVGEKDLNYHVGLGITLFGDSYKVGWKLVTKVNFN